MPPRRGLSTRRTASGPQWRILVEQIVARHGAIHRARRGEDEALHAGFLRRPRNSKRSFEVDLVIHRNEIAQRVVRECCEMDDCLEAVELARRDITDVGSDNGTGSPSSPKSQPL